MTDSKKRRLAKKRRLEELQAGNIKSKTNDIVLRDDERSWMHVVGSFARENDELKFKLDSLQKEFQKYRTHVCQMIKNPVSIISLFYYIIKTDSEKTVNWKYRSNKEN